MSQGKFWLLTIPAHAFVPYCPPTVQHIKGQLEAGNEGGYLHWQIIVCFVKKVRLQAVKDTFGQGIHAELSRSAAANEYVHKEDTAVAGTRFELGNLPIKRNSKEDWDRIRQCARTGELDTVPSDIYIKYFSSLKRIASEFQEPQAIEKEVIVLWGPTGTGKSRRAWEEAGLQAYPKDPNTKFWDGYRGQKHVVIDEFRGTVNVSNVLRWLDRYPVIIEVKGGAVPLCATKVWITSNVDPRKWYAGEDVATQQAVLRRLRIVHVPMLLY